MAFSKIAGLEVTPRRESSRTRRSSSPDSIIPRRIWSSQTLVPASVRAASRSFTWVAASIRLLSEQSQFVLRSALRMDYPEEVLPQRLLRHAVQDERVRRLPARDAGVHEDGCF